MDIVVREAPQTVSAQLSTFIHEMSSHISGMLSSTGNVLSTYALCFALPRLASSGGSGGIEQQAAAAFASVDADSEVSIFSQHYISLKERGEELIPAVCDAVAPQVTTSDVVASCIIRSDHT